MTLRRAIFVAAVIICGFVFPMTVRGEYPASTQIYGNSGAPRFAGSIQIPSATYATPSEVRMAIHASGATPSELRANFNQIGPLTASGAISYVPYRPSAYEVISLRAQQMTHVVVEARSTLAPTNSTETEPPAPAAGLAPPANQFATGAFARNIKRTLPLSPGFEGWITSGAASPNRRPTLLWRPSSFSTALLESLRAEPARDSE